MSSRTITIDHFLKLPLATSEQWSKQATTLFHHLARTLQEPNTTIQDVINAWESYYERPLPARHEEALSQQAYPLDETFRAIITNDYHNNNNAFYIKAARDDDHCAYPLIKIAYDTHHTHKHI